MWAEVLSRSPNQKVVNNNDHSTHKILRRKRTPANKGISQFSNTTYKPIRKAPVSEAFPTSAQPQAPNCDQVQSSSFRASETASSRASEMDLPQRQTEDDTSPTSNESGSYATTGLGVLDSLGLNTDLPAKVNTAGSPRSVSVTPKSVTYTTVGSLVDPNVKHNLSAPNRVQREGSGRQGLMTMGQRGQHEYHHSPQGSLPQLQRTNSQAYAQLIANSPYNNPKPSQGAYQSQNTFSTTAGTPAQPRLGLIDQEMDEFKELQPPRVVPSSMAGPSYASMPSSSWRRSSSTPTFGARVHMGEGNEQAKIAVGSVPEEDNIKIQQQVLAMDNAYSKLYSSQNTTSIFSVEPLPEHAVSSPRRNENQSEGELSQAYRYPPPGVRSRSTTQLNPLLAASAIQSTKDRGHQPSYPQPLTAGPPGQRQYPTVTTKLATANMHPNSQPSPSHAPQGVRCNIPPSQDGSHSLNLLSANPTTASAANVHDAGAQLSKGCTVPQNPTFNYADSRGPPVIVDTLPPSAVACYYPYGIPSDMAGIFAPVSEEKQKHIDYPALSAEEKRRQRRKELDDFFFGGQRRVATMGIENYLNEMADRQNGGNIFGPIAPPKKTFPPGPIVKKPITEEEMEKMTTAEATAPFIEAAFGALLSYTEEGPDSRKALSGFIPAPQWQVDNTKVGMRSVFEDDPDLPPPRLDSDPRYQAGFQTS